NEMRKDLREVLVCAVLAVAIVLVVTIGVIIAGGMVRAARNPNAAYGQQVVKTGGTQWQCLTETVRGKTTIVGCETIKENQ
ncbi:hypothetical protein, partial [Bifidobacterium panos]